MKAPGRLQSLIEEGLIDTVVRQLMSGKEAMVYVVRCGDETRCAKIYKEATQRSFRQAVDYTENRRVKNSRQARAMAKGTKFGRQAQEAAWQSAEVDALYRLAAAGVRVPQPHNFHDGVLLMELVTDAHGDVAPRLNDVSITPELLATSYGPEIWDLYQRGMLDTDVALTGHFVRPQGAVDLGGVLREIGDAQAEEQARRLRMQSAAWPC